jgi:CBS domain-containing protein
MGILGTAISFGAGYVVGAKTGKEPVERIQARLLPGRGAHNRDAETVDVRQVSEVMTATPQTLPLDATVTRAAVLMAENEIGDVIVTERGSQEVAGIVTDRDIAIRAVGAGLDPDEITVEDIFSRDLVAVAPTTSLQEALTMMRTLLVRRLPVVEGGIAIGVVSLGDLSQTTDAGSTLANISAGPPDL